MKKKSKNDFMGANLKMLQLPFEQISGAFDKVTKIGVFKELHKKGLLNDYELSTLITKQDKNYFV